MNQIAKRPDAVIPEPAENAGGMALRPQSISECYRLAGAIFQAGMGPKGLNQQAIMLIMMSGMELGLGPMASLRGLAVINNRVTIFGDVMTAMVRQRGHGLRSWYDPASGTNMTAHCELTRGDTGEKTVRSFSMENAKRAKLLGKSGPWTDYPERMIMWRAVSWACRDGASDALMGTMAYEEAIDIPAPVQATAIEAPAARRPAPPAQRQDDDDALRIPDHLRRNEPQAEPMDVGTLLSKMPDARDAGGWLFDSFEAYIAKAILPWLEGDDIRPAAAAHIDDVIAAIADLQAEDEAWGEVQIFGDWEAVVREKVQ